LEIIAHTLELLHIKAADGCARTQRGPASIRILGDEERSKKNLGPAQSFSNIRGSIRNKESRTK
jgi:hypothetical protein